MAEALREFTGALGREKEREEAYRQRAEEKAEARAPGGREEPERTQTRDDGRADGRERDLPMPDRGGGGGIER